MRKGRWTYTMAGLTLVAACGWALATAARSDKAPAAPASPASGVVMAGAAPPSPAAAPGTRAPRVWRVAGDDGDGEAVRVITTGGSAWLGVRIDDVGAEAAAELRLDRAYGARVTDVIEDGPADRAGLMKDDVIVEFDRQPVPGTRSLRRLVGETPEGRTVGLKVIRDGREMRLDVEIERRSARSHAFAFPGSEGDLDIEIPEIEIPDIESFHFEGKGPHMRRFELFRGPRLGVQVQSISGQLADHFGVKAGEGVLISEVLEDTPAERAGLKAGDVITELAGERIRGVGDLHEALGKHEGETVGITVIRDRSERGLDVTLDKPERRGSSDLGDEERIEIETKLRTALEAERKALDAGRLARVREAMRLRREAMEASRESRQLREQERREQLERLQEQLQERMRELREKLETVSGSAGAVQI